MIVKRIRMEESFGEGAHWRYRRYGDIHGDANLPRTVATRLPSCARRGQTVQGARAKASFCQSDYTAQN